MRISNTYIFLEDKSAVQTSKGGKLQIILTPSVSNILKDLFNLEYTSTKDKSFVRTAKTAKTEITIDESSCSVTFKCTEVVKTTYLEVTVEGANKPHIIKVMEFIHKQINQGDNKLEEYYICIVSYDAISEYYCNKLYPRLNVFERQLRRLMFNLYTVNFGKEYLEKTTGEKLHMDIQKKVLFKQAANLKPKDKKKLLKTAFYSLDYSDILTLLFDKRWSDYDEEQKELFLAKHNDLSEVSDEELRAAFVEMRPKSDWERFFSDKIPKMNVDEDIDIIRQTRNKVAHCKELDKVEYREIMKLLNKLIKDIDKAILLTEERDFVLKNQEYLTNSLSKISDTMKIFTKDFQDSISALFKSFQLSIKEMQKPFDNLRLGLMLNSNPFFFEKGNNDQEDN